jgi:AcrR family transcriptional regulator
MKRARSEEQKTKRREVILHAALRLFKTRRYRLISMSDVAAAAHLAKGSVYLYFETREDLFLAVLRRELSDWFEEIETALPGAEGPEAVADALCASLARREAMTKLLTILHTVLEQNVDFQTALSFKMFLAVRVLETGRLLEISLPFLAPGEGAATLLHIDAFLMGLRQLSDPSPVVKRVLRRPGLSWFRVDFQQAVYEAVRAYLRGKSADRSRQ